MPIYPYSFQLPPLNVQDIPNDGAVGEFLGISAGGVLDWLPVSASGGGDMLKSENLSGLADYPTARTNLGLGTGDSPTFKNLTISTGTITTSAPVTISQTWNELAVAFTAFKVNATSTNSALGSLLLDLQLGGLRRFTVAKDGWTNIGSSDTGSAIRMLDLTNQYGNVGFQVGGGGRLDIMNGGTTTISIFNSGVIQATVFSVAGVQIARDADNTLALRNGINPQTFNVYGTYTSGSAYARLAIACDTSGNATLTTQSTGTAGTVSINGVPVGLGPGNITSSVAIGTNAMAARTDGTQAVAIGHLSLLYATNINRTTAIGYGAGATLGNGAQNTSSLDSVFIGNDTRSFAVNQTNQIVIGYNTTGLGSNTAVLGNASITTTALRGNVGIGTTAPAAKLHVVGNAIFGQNTAQATATPVNVSFGGTYGTNTPGNKGNLKWDLYSDGTDRSGIGISTGLIEFQGGVNAGFGFYPNNGTTSALHIIPSGNVGIGTTAPSSKLDVVGAVTVSTYIKVSPVAVTSLPAAATAGVGARAFVNDALAPVFGSAVANGGSAKVPVYSDGSAWYVG